MTERPTGYRGALPPRNDALAAPWVIAVIAIFLLIFLLAFLGFPSKFVSRASGSPQPSASVAASGTQPPTQ
jgi:hypothetical protein